ncbi:MAG TPA: EthD family reductase [Dehalococcoidia bacterium]|nr:EthD family reductase [Dehalococcoidia bacterium]
MIKLLGAMKRKTGMSLTDFQSYWHEVHAPMIARSEGLLRYVQSHPIAELHGEMEQAFDGIAEAWFESIEAFENAVASPGWQDAIKDAPNFIGIGGGRILASEVPIVDAFPSARERQANGMVKYLGFLTRKPGLSVEQFQQHWRDVHGPLVRSEIAGMRRYVQLHTLPETYSITPAPAWDGVPEAWFDSLDAYPKRLGYPREGPATTPGAIDSENTFVQPIPAVIAREFVIVDNID